MRRFSQLQAVTLLTGIFIGACEDRNSSIPAPHEMKAAAFDFDSGKEHIREITRLFTEAHITKDTAYLNNIFTENARVFPPNSPMASGRFAVISGIRTWSLNRPNRVNNCFVIAISMTSRSESFVHTS